MIAYLYQKNKERTIITGGSFSGNVYDSINLQSNLDGSLSIRKPLIFNQNLKNIEFYRMKFVFIL